MFASTLRGRLFNNDKKIRFIKSIVYVTFVSKHGEIKYYITTQ